MLNNSEKPGEEQLNAAPSKPERAGRVSRSWLAVLFWIVERAREIAELKSRKLELQLFRSRALPTIQKGTASSLKKSWKHKMLGQAASLRENVSLLFLLKGALSQQFYCILLKLVKCFTKNILLEKARKLVLALIMSDLADRSAMLGRCLHVVWSVPLTDSNVAQVRSYTTFAVIYTLKRSRKLGFLHGRTNL